jgi:WD40 repeat protein
MPSAGARAMARRCGDLFTGDHGLRPTTERMEGPTAPPMELTRAERGGLWVSLKFPPLSSGPRVVTASWDHSARVWDAATGKPLSTLTGHGSYVRSAAFSPEGTRVVTASEDNKLHAVLATLAMSGLRVAELTALRPGDVDLAGGWIHVRNFEGRTTKGGGVRKVPIHGKLLVISESTSSGVASARSRSSPARGARSTRVGASR